MNAKFITKALKDYYEVSARYLVPNIYFFDYKYGETDLLVVRNSKGWIYDIEIKISRADFKNDFKKVQKHNILRDGQISFTTRRSIKLPSGKWKMLKANTPLIITDRPNRFYFAVPEGLITAEETPKYAGLLYINKGGSITKIKEAKLLHREVVPHESRLCRKFYFRWLNQLKR